MGLKAAWQALRAPVDAPVEERDFPTISVDAWLNMMAYNGVTYPLGASTLAQPSKKEITDSYVGLCSSAYKKNGVIFACMLARQLAFSEARFQFRRIQNGRPGGLFGTQELGLLEVPWPNGTTGDLLSRAIQDVDLEGDFFAYRAASDRVVRLRPDWVDIILGSNLDADAANLQVDATVVGYAYTPGGRNSGQKMQVFTVDEVAHWCPIPDPEARFRGMSWLKPILTEIQADSAATQHKEKYFEKGATPNLIMTMPPGMNKTDFEDFKKKFTESNVGVQNAYKTLFLMGGSTAQVVGSDLKQIDFKVTQGAGETRIAAAAGVPPIVVGLSEGLQAATYSNYGQAMRRFADLTMRPLWRNFAASMQTIINVPAGAELWYDDRDVPFLADAATDTAAIQSVQAGTIHTLIAAGFTPDSAVGAVLADDFQQLEHTGLYSVQLQPAGKVTLGKGSLVQGVPAPTNSDAQPQLEAASSNVLQLAAESRRLLAAFVERDENVIDIVGGTR